MVAPTTDPGPSTPAELRRPLRVLGFLLGGVAYGIEARWVREAVLYAQPTPLGSLPGFVIGVLAVRDQMVPVFDLAMLLDLPPTRPQLHSAILLVEIGGQRIGLIVERIATLWNIEPSMIVEKPLSLQGPRLDYVACASPLEDRLMLIVDLPKILTEWHLEIALEGSRHGCP